MDHFFFVFEVSFRPTCQLLEFVSVVTMVSDFIHSIMGSPSWICIIFLAKGWPFLRVSPNFFWVPLPSITIITTNSNKRRVTPDMTWKVVPTVSQPGYVCTILGTLPNSVSPLQPENSQFVDSLSLLWLLCQALPGCFYPVASEQKHVAPSLGKRISISKYPLVKLKTWCWKLHKIDCTSIYLFLTSSPPRYNFFLFPITNMSRISSETTGTSMLNLDDFPVMSFMEEHLFANFTAKMQWAVCPARWSRKRPRPRKSREATTCQKRDVSISCGQSNSQPTIWGWFIPPWKMILRVVYYWVYHIERLTKYHCWLVMKQGSIHP